ncbi:MAG: DUF4091 domain-containing protein [Leptospiraceae bacterium]|nr:DUF4091 domain-containing protein [Leptospiraceae bacterium]MCP5501459.1 DUF4091 domain-containing protein [Leptospiraceae bacterium]
MKLFSTFIILIYLFSSCSYLDRFLGGEIQSSSKKERLLLLGGVSSTVNTPSIQDFSYKLSQSTEGFTLWTTPPSERVFQKGIVPDKTISEINVFAAKNEYEPFQLVVNPSVATSVNVSIDSFGEGISAELSQVKYVNITTVSDNLGKTGAYPDPLWPLSSSATVSLPALQNTSFWITLYVAKTVNAGDYTANVHIGSLSVPVKLHVFNFALPDEPQVHSQMNFNYNTVLSKYGVSGTGEDYWKYVDMMKLFFIQHRLTPKSVNWPGGITGTGAGPFINYDCNTATLSDTDGIWGFDSPSDKYVNGNGFHSGVGFPTFMAATFRNNDSSLDQRPDTFCGITRASTDWYAANNPSSAYNQKWFQYITVLQNYLKTKGFIQKAYYYMANEPQDQADYDAIVWYSKELKKVAPDLKLMVSEEPRPEIYNSGKIDIWLPVLHNYNPDVSHSRQINNAEETWIYFLYGTRPPFFNPITLDHPGIESKLTGWFLWKYRIRGIAYYSMNDWSKNPYTEPATSNHNGDTFMLYPPSEDNSNISYGSNQHRLVSSIRLELMRDSLEDYEYFYLLNASSHPVPGTTNEADAQVNKIISGLTAYSRNSEYLYTLRKVIGQKLGGEISTIPELIPSADHTRAEGSPGNYYINFQDPNSSPESSPLVVDGKEYMKIGWSQYNKTDGYGWYGDLTHVKYQYLSSGSNELQKSIIYDDWGRQKTFEFDLPNGTYSVTVSVGWQGKTYSHNKILIEGISFINDEASAPYIEKTLDVIVADRKLTMEMGIFDEYTMLNYLKIEAK